MNNQKLAPAPIFDKAVILLLVLTQILKTYGPVSYYNFASIPTYIFGLIFICMLLAGKRRFQSGQSMPKPLVYFFIYWAISHVLTNLHNGIVPQNVIECSLTFILFWGIVTPDRFPRLLKYYTVVAWICIAFFILQEASYRFTGMRISGIIPGLPIALNTVEDASSFISEKMSGTRSASFFSEPAYLAQYIMPLFAIELFYDKNSKHYLKVLITGLVILLTLSGTGIAAMGMVVMVYVLSLMVKRSFLSKVVVVIMFITGFVGLPYIMETEIGENLIGRQTEMSMDYEGGSRSGFMRLYRGLYVYDEYSSIEKVFGHDNNAAIQDHIAQSAFAYTFSDNQDTFFNGVQYTLLRTGIVGLIIMSLLFIQIYRKNNVCGRAILFGFIALMFMEAVFFGNNMVLFLILAERMKYQQIQES